MNFVQTQVSLDEIDCSWMKRIAEKGHRNLIKMKKVGIVACSDAQKEEYRKQNEELIVGEACIRRILSVLLGREIRISSDGGKSFAEQMYLPEDGIIPLPDVGVELVFTGSDNESLMVEGDSYSVDAVKENYMPLIVGVIVFILAALGVLYVAFRRYMLRQLPGPSDYRIESYIPYAERGKQSI